jgi:phage-related protein (TIGR01555 family)
MDDLRLIEGAKARADGWTNIMTGLGGAADKAKYTRARQDALLSDMEAEALYTGDGLATRIIDLLPDDMFRQGWDFEFEETEVEEEKKAKAQVFIDAFDEMKVETKLNLGHKWARLYGGAVAVIGALDGKPLDKPLNASAIKEWDEIRIVDRSDIDFGQIMFQLDPLKKRYLKPETYPIKYEAANGVQETRRVHWSRVIEIHGQQVPEGASAAMRRETRYWGLSMLQAPYDILGHVGTAFGSMGNLLQEASVGKYKLKDLADIMTVPDGDRAVQKRIEAMDLMKSVFHSVYLDSDEDYIRESIQIAGVAELIYAFFMMISANTGYPITRLFGVSPAGMNATGESDMLNYFDMVASRQKTDLAPQLRYLVKLVAEKEGVEEPNVVFRPLKQMTEKEKADLEKLREEALKIKMETYNGYISAGVLQAAEVRYLNYGTSLDDLPIPEDQLPPPVKEAAPAPPIAPKAAKLETINARIAELEALRALTSEQEEELQDLKAQAATFGQN